jgi:general secretion pathway protein G
MVNPSLRNSTTDRSPGYTLVELLVVLALLSMLAGLTIPRFHNSYGRSQLRQAAWQLARDLTTGRLLAIDDGCNYVVRHQLVGARYSILPQHQVSLQSAAQGGMTPPPANVGDREVDELAPARAGETNSAADVTQQLTYDESMDEELPNGVVFGAADAALQRDTSAPDALANLTSQVSSPSVMDEGEAVPGQLVANSSWTKALVFYPDGRSDSAEVTLHAENGYVVRLTVRGLTGGVTIGPIERPAQLTADQETVSRPPPDTATSAAPTRNESTNAR